jgi:hypothetical protein
MQETIPDSVALRRAKKEKYNTGKNTGGRLCRRR